MGRVMLMKKFDDIVRGVDRYVDKHFNTIKSVSVKYFSVFSSTLLLLLLAVFIVRVINNKPYFMASVINEDLAKLSKILHKIDAECNIMNVTQERGVIDFLTVEKFLGSEVGCLNLAFPEKWKGPYLKNTPRLSGRCYEIVSVDEGYFIVPGNGVSLPNGMVLGRDIKLSHKISLKKLIADGGVLNYKGQPLGVHLQFKVKANRKSLKSEQQAKTIDGFLKEFNEAMVFTKNDAVTKHENAESLANFG